MSRNVQIVKKDGSVHVLPEEIAKKLIKSKKATLHTYSAKAEKKPAKKKAVEKPAKDKEMKSAPKDK